MLLDFQKAKEAKGEPVNPLLWNLLERMNKKSQNLAPGKQNVPAALRGLLKSAKNPDTSAPSKKKSRWFF